MNEISRRRFLRSISGGLALSIGACRSLVPSASRAHVVVIGGGFGGASAAKTLRLLDSRIEVTLIEPNVRYTTCPGSNWLFAGLTDLHQLSVDYQALKDRYGIKVVANQVRAIERDSRQVKLASGERIAYDRMILSPGIAFQWEAIEGYDADTAEHFPHAWRAGPQTLLLVRQIRSMPIGGVVLIAAPPDPYRCPPGPYERASMIAYWLKQHNPTAKIIILDPKRSFSKQALFENAWAKYYGYGSANSLIEWHCLADNPIVRVEKGSKTLVTEFGDRFDGDVINIIPPQLAADIATESALTNDKGWCPIHPQTSQSSYDEYIHVIGDAAHYAPMPKSAFAANSEAKACAISVTSLLNERPLIEPNWVNTCYSLVTPEHGISVVGVYKLDAAGQTIASVAGAGGVSRHTSAEVAEREAGYALSAYRGLVNDSFR
ncbi:MAG: FCSD flavin-binding domain-containing protein [Gammaproteobacteria bacterium]